MAGQETFPPPPDGIGGLSEAEAALRLESVGPNLMVPERRSGGWSMLLWRSVTEPMSILLLVAAATYLLLGDGVDAAAALAALVPIAAVSIVLERRAERALEELAALTAPTARVWRDSAWLVIPAGRVVPGDLLGVQEGDVVPADGIVVVGTGLLVDESALTGESLPVSKDADGDDREVWAGTMFLAGRGIVDVRATGLATRYGEIGKLLAATGTTRTPLELSVRQLVVRLGALAVLFAILVGAVEMARGGNWGDAVIAGVSLGMAAVPEEFPLVFTVYLALGARRLAGHRALVRRLTGVETLGSTTVICTDKTGTLTLGSLAVSHVLAAPGVDPRNLVQAAVAACEPHPFDPLDQAIIGHAGAEGLDTAAILNGNLVMDFEFDPLNKNVTHVWQDGDRIVVAAKGALEGMLAITTSGTDVRSWGETEMLRLGGEGVRVIAVAGGHPAELPPDRAGAEGSIAMLGLIGFSDPTRPEVPGAVADCRTAGIRVVMITGDHPVTARAVAEGLGLIHDGPSGLVTGDDLDRAPDAGELIESATVFARIRPEQKHRIVSVLRQHGQVVAMTGDGINDAPALREADIGVAMGRRGTAVAREASTLVLLDDNFATIVEAVREGRRIFSNLRQAFAYLVAFHVPLLVLALAMPTLGRPLLLLPFNLIALEFLLHPIATLAFEHDPGPPGLMNRPPRPREEGLFGRWLGVPILRGLSLAVAVGALYLTRLDAYGEERARALALACLFIGELLLVLTRGTTLAPGRNRMLPGVLAGGLAVVAILFLLPAARRVMGVAPISPVDWLAAAAVAAVATLWNLGRKSRPPAG